MGLTVTNTALDKLDLVGDEATGAAIVRVALTAPLRRVTALFLTSEDLVADKH